MNGPVLSRFSLDGMWLGQQRLPETHGVAPMALAWACGGTWFAYGPPSASRGSQPKGWLHEIDLEVPGATKERLASTGTLRIGALEGLDGGPDGVFLWHRQVGRAEGWWVPCLGKPEKLHRRMDQAQEENEPVPTPRGGVMILPDTVFAGAALSLEPLVAFRPRAGPRRLTIVEALRTRGCRVIMTGRWRLLDAVEDEILLTRTDLFPELVVVRWSDLFPATQSCVH